MFTAASTCSVGAGLAPAHIDCLKQETQLVAAADKPEKKALAKLSRDSEARLAASDGGRSSSKMAAGSGSRGKSGLVCGICMKAPGKAWQLNSSPCRPSKVCYRIQGFDGSWQV